MGEIQLQIKAMSGELVATLSVRPDETVSSVLQSLPRVNSAPAGMHSLVSANGVMLPPHASLTQAGVEDGAVLTVVQAFVRWHAEHKGRLAEIDESRRVVRRHGAEFSDSIVILDTQMRAFSVRIVEVVDCRFGGLEIGFSTLSPEELPDVLPTKLDKLPGVLISDGVGSLHADDPGLVDAWLSPEHHWSRHGPESLGIGDVLYCQVNADRFIISVNGSVVADWPSHITCAEPVYPIANVYGRVRAIELVL